MVTHFKLCLNPLTSTKKLTPSDKTHATFASLGLRWPDGCSVKYTPSEDSNKNSGQYIYCPVCVVLCLLVAVVIINSLGHLFRGLHAMISIQSNQKLDGMKSKKQSVIVRVVMMRNNIQGAVPRKPVLGVWDRLVCAAVVRIQSQGF